MKKLTKIAMSTLLLATVLSGCGGGSERPKDEMIIAAGGDVKDLDPAIASDSISNNVLVDMYDGLFEYDETGNLNPQLCDSYTLSDDKLTYTFKLKDAKWSDGKEITADDFVYGIKRSATYGPRAYYAHFVYDNVVGTKDAFDKNLKVAEVGDEGVKAIDKKTLQINLVAPTPYFLSLLTSGVYYPARPDIAKEKKSTWANKPGYPTSGAFSVKSYNAKDKIELVKNDKYVNAKKVFMKKLTFKVMPDQQAQLQAFKTGEVDLATSVPADVSVNKDYKKTLYTIDPFVINYYITINATGENKALQDVRVRKALMMSTDRASVLKVLNGGKLQYELYGFIPKGIPDATGDFRGNADKESKYAGYDIEQAKALLAEAGYSKENPLKLTYKTNANQMHSDVIQTLQASWKKIGIEVEISQMEVQAFFDARDDGDFEIARHAMTADYMDPTAYLDMYKSTSQKTAVVNDATYDGLLAQAAAEGDPAARMAILHQAEKYLVEEQAYVIPVFGYSDPMLLKEGIKGIQANPAGHYNLSFVTNK
ncbi:MAG: peptide ABC transporter substrate-binding protein [Erysipelotrichaceae bacterium]